MKTTKEIIRIGGKLKEIVTIHDETGNIIHKIMSPLMVEFYLRDVLQVIIGATILAIPIAFTEETWRLGSSLETGNIAALGILSILFMSLFIYYNSYKGRMEVHFFGFIKRVIATYLISLIIVALILTIINQAPWFTDHIVAIKRTIIVAFPASLSAAVADTLK